MHEALFYERKNGKVRCQLCNHNCTIADGKRGICGVRENRQGVLYTLVYGKAIAANSDPIEKKPLFHFYPGSRSFSIATAGCNFHCLNCQNSDISQMPKGEGGRIIGDDLPPDDVVAEAKRRGCASISYTYTEPTIFFEYAYETAKLGHNEGIKNVFVTNGFTGEKALRKVAPYLDAANVDLKSFSDDFYKKVCGARLQPVLDNIRLYRELGIWIEVTTLLIPGYSDDERQLLEIASFLVDVDRDIPWHITAFHPAYRMPEVPQTTVTALRRARQIGIDAGLRYVYEGNVPGEGGENTYCHQCGELLIERLGFSIRQKRIAGGCCPGCGSAVAGVAM